MTDLLWAFQKERQLQTHVIKSGLNEANSPEQFQELAEEIAKVARTTFFEFRFGHFSTANLSAVYVNMGPTNLWVREHLERRAHAAGRQVLASAMDSSTDPYTFAIFIDCGDGELWEDIARSIWSQGRPSN